MAFTFDAKAKVNLSVANPVVLAFTCAVNCHLLVLGIMTLANTARTGTAPTYNGVAMTQVGATQVGSAECTAELWYLSNPATGAAHDISVPNTGGATITLIASSYIDAGATGAKLDVYNQTNVTVANPSLTVTTNSNGEAIVDVLGSGGPTATADIYTQRLLYMTDEGVWSSHGQYALQAVAGDITFSWDKSSDDVAFIVGAFSDLVLAVADGDLIGIAVIRKS